MHSCGATPSSLGSLRDVADSASLRPQRLPIRAGILRPLPHRRDMAEVIATEGVAHAPRARHPGTLLHLVLIVDNKERILLVLGRGLRGLSSAADTAAKGTYAVAMIMSRSYDLVILDLLVPGQDGFSKLRDRAVRCSAGQLHSRILPNDAANTTPRIGIENQLRPAPRRERRAGPGRWL